MKTEDIDLTKCNNCRFRAKDEDGDISGRIKISERGTVYLFVDGQGNKGFDDFEIVPRDPETYKDWQVGDRATDPNEKWNDSAYKEIIFRSGELVICKDGNGDISGGYTCGPLKSTWSARKAKKRHGRRKRNG